MPLTQLIRSERDRFLRFVVTGCAGFVVDFGALLVLHGMLGVRLGVATVGAYFAGGTVHYSLTRHWVFPQRSHGELGRLSRYVVLVGVNAALTVLVVLGLSAVGVEYWIAKLVAVAGLFLTNYAIMPRLVMTSPALTEFPSDGPHDVAETA